MENLSSEELSLLLDIYREPNQRLSMYGHRLRVPYSQVLAAQNDLLSKNLIFEQNSGRLILNLTEIEEQNLKIILENGETPDVEPVEVPKPLETETVSKLQKFTDVNAKVLEMLKASPHGRTAKELAAPFGTKGTSLVWTLRKMVDDQQIVKRDTKYFLAEECDKVVNVPVPPADERREVSTNLEIITFILQQEGSFTQNELYETMSKTYKIDKDKFCELFTDAVLDGYYNVHDGVDFVQHDLDYSPDNKHERCINVSGAEGIAELMNDFVAVWEKFDLQAAVRETGLRHDRITTYLSGAGWDVSDTKNIHKAKPVDTGHTRYTRFDEIDVNAARQLVFGIVKLDVFIKRFNLDPTTKDEVVKLLELVKVAQYDEVSGFLGPVKAKPKQDEEFVQHYNSDKVEKVGVLIKCDRADEIHVETSGTVQIDTEHTEVVGDKLTIKGEQGTVKAEFPLSDLNAVSTAPDSTTILPKDNFDFEKAIEDVEAGNEDAGIVDYDADEDEAEPETIIKTSKGFASGFNYDTRFKLDHAAPVEQPTHIDNRSSPLYGHKILGMHVEMGTYSIDPNPDFIWMAAQPDATEQEKALGLLTRENMIGILKKRYPMRAIGLDEIDPSQPVEVTLEMDWEGLQSPDIFGMDPEPETELHNVVEEDQPKAKCWHNKPEHDLRVGPCGPSGPDDSGIGGPGTAYPHPIGPTGADGNSSSTKEAQQTVKPQWTMTLQMLAERFQHEHQYTTAQILRDIHDHLAPK